MPALRPPCWARRRLWTTPDLYIPRPCIFRGLAVSAAPFSSTFAAALCLSLAGLGMPAQAAVFDFLFGKKEAEAVSPAQRNWSLGQFTAIELVARELDAPVNQHPADWPAGKVRQQLASVSAMVDGVLQPLFFETELDTLAGPVSQALSVAGPNDDLLLLSTHRRGGGIFVPPSAVTARLFVQDGRLQLIVRDARLDFYNQYLGSRAAPTFSYGTRATAGTAVLRSEAAASRRADWLSISAEVSAAAPSLPAAAVMPLKAAVQDGAGDARKPMPVAEPKAGTAAKAGAPRRTRCSPGCRAARCWFHRRDGAAPADPQALAGQGPDHRGRVPAKAQGSAATPLMHVPRPMRMAVGAMPVPLCRAGRWRALDVVRPVPPPRPWRG